MEEHDLLIIVSFSRCKLLKPSLQLYSKAVLMTNARFPLSSAILLNFKYCLSDLILLMMSFHPRSRHKARQSNRYSTPRMLIWNTLNAPKQVCLISFRLRQRNRSKRCASLAGRFQKSIKSMRVQASQQWKTTQLLIAANGKKAHFLFYHVILEELRVTGSRK